MMFKCLFHCAPSASTPGSQFARVVDGFPPPVLVQLRELPNCCDFDILIDATEETSLFDVGAIRSELSELLGVEVDVLTPEALPDRWKGRVLDEAQAV